MKHSIQQDRRRRLLVRKYEIKRLSLKKILLDEKLSHDQRFKAQIALDKLPKNSSRVRVRNRCVITGRARGVDSTFRLSRILLRDMCLFGRIVGVKKASW